MELCKSDLQKAIQHFKQVRIQQQNISLNLVNNNSINEEEKKLLFQNGFCPVTVLPLEIIGKFFVHLTLGLEGLHQRNVLHRDMKTENILLTTNPIQTGWNDCVLKIADLGFSRELEINNLAQTMCGTPLYMAPEGMHVFFQFSLFFSPFSLFFSPFSHFFSIFRHFFHNFVIFFRFFVIFFSNFCIFCSDFRVSV